MIKFILILLLFALPLTINNHCYETGYIKHVIMFIGSVWISYFLWLKKPKLPDYSVLLFLGWVVASYLVSPFKFGNPAEVLLTYFCYLTIYIAARDYLPLETLEKCLAWIMYILLGLFIYSFWGRWSYLFTNLKDFGCFEHRSNFGIAGVMAGWLIMAMPVLLARRRYIACFMGLFLLWLTGSRSAALGACFAFLALAYVVTSTFQYKIVRIWLKIITIIVSCSILISIVWFCYPKLSQQSERFSYWQSALNMTIDRPVAGYGIGSFRVIYPKYRNPYITEIYKTPNIDLHHTHNLFLEMGSEIGLVGIGLFLWLVFRHWRKSKNWPLIAGTTAILIANITDVSYFYQPVGFLFWLMLGIMAKDIVSKPWFEDAMDDFYNR